MTAHNPELNAQRLLKLSDEVTRIANTLVLLSGQSAPDAGGNRECESRDPEIEVQAVRAAIRARRLRDRYFDQELFADPAWDMMLDLFEAELSQRRVAVSSLCIAAAVPPTTALRWLQALAEKGLFVRRDDPFDGRRVYVELAHDVSVALHRYFGQVGNSPLV
jgi:hypothetical protein